MEDAGDHLVKDDVAGRGGDGPLAELDPVGDVDPAVAVTSVELDAYDEADLVADAGGYPFVNRLEGDCVCVCVHAAIDAENEIAQEVRLHSHVGHFLVCLDHIRLAGKVLLHKRISAVVPHECTTKRRGSKSAFSVHSGITASHKAESGGNPLYITRIHGQPRRRISKGLGVDDRAAGLAIL